MKPGKIIAARNVKTLGIELSGSKGSVFLFSVHDDKRECMLETCPRRKRFQEKTFFDANSDGKRTSRFDNHARGELKIGLTQSAS
jgi:hypothetical protein